MNTISKRLKLALETRNMKQIDLVSATGIGKSSISTYLSGEYEPKQKNIYKISKALNVNEGWLMGLDVPMERDDAFSDDTEETTPIPLVGEVAAGLGAYAENNVIDYIKTPNSWLKGEGEHVYLKVTGDSMEPEMHSGDLALIRVQTSIDSGDYAVVIIDGENGVVKRVIYDSNWVELQSVNTMYASRRFENEDLERVRVFGVVRKILRNYDGSLKLAEKKPKSLYKLKGNKDIGIELYNRLDTEDKSKIRVTMEEMLKSEKYTQKDTVDDPFKIIDNYIKSWNSNAQIAAQGKGVRTVNIPDTITDEELLKMIEDSQKFKTE